MAEIVELIFLGMGVGALSGFFGIGGGTILVPALLFIGFDMKMAVGISVMQMVFSSIYGSYLNLKKGTLDIKMVLMIGLGGFAGALTSNLIVSTLSSTTLEWIFLGFVLFAMARMFMHTPNHGETEVKTAHPVILFAIGMVLGAFSISIGVGGSILLVPILAGFLHVPLKNAISAGLFFVVFSSVSGLISLSIGGHIDYFHGILIGVASMVGVFGGIWLKHVVPVVHHKRFLMAFYLIVSSYFVYRLVVA
jgi:uncharacterized membrane protein YfcA